MPKLNARVMDGRFVVLHAIPTLGGGGAEKQLVMLSHALQERGIEVHVVCVSGGVHEQALRDGGVTLHVHSHRGNHDPMLLVDLWRLMRRLRPAIVQTWLMQMDILAGVAAQWLSIPHVLSERASAEAYPGGWKARLRCRIGARADAVVANSSTGLRYWQSAGMRGTPSVIRNGTAADEIDTSRPACPQDAGLPVGAPIVLFAGRLVEQKNLPLLMDAMEIVLASDSAVVFLLFGEGPLKPWLEMRIAAMGAKDRVFLRGYSLTLPSWMKTASVVVSTSRFEGAPNVVIESMLAGCPLVVSDISEHRELLTNDMGVLSSADSPDAFASGVIAVLRDSEAAAKRAMLAKRTAQAWTIASAAQAYVNIYSKLAYKNDT